MGKIVRPDKDNRRETTTVCDKKGAAPHILWGAARKTGQRRTGFEGKIRVGC